LRTISKISSTICGARPHGRLVEQDHGRPRHERPPDRRHLLLAARGVSGLRRSPLLEAREEGVHLLQVELDLGARGVAGIGAREQVVLDREVAEAMPPFHHLDHAALHQVGRGHRIHALPAQLDRSLGHLAALGAQQVRHGLERRGLARAVGAQEGDDAALRDTQRHALQHRMTWL
jgi:hypothetical protein